MKKSLFILFIALFVFSCSKNNVKPEEENPSDGIVYIQKIDSIHILHLHADTTRRDLSSIQKTFPSPVDSIKTKVTTEGLPDSISRKISIERKNDLQFKEPVRLPLERINERLDLDSYRMHPIHLKEYQVSERFPSFASPFFFVYKAASNMNGYTITRQYDWIQFDIDIKLYITDNKGDTTTLNGKIERTKIGQTYNSFRYF